MKTKNYKKELATLTKAVAQFLSAFDAVMKEASTEKRGGRLAKLANDLEMINDGKMFFGLGYGWKKIANIKKIK